MYRADESLRVSQPQGWQHFFVEFAWDVLFPLSTAGGRYWVEALGGPAMEPSQHAYCARCFIDSALRAMAVEAKERPVFWAVHTCYMHEPPTLHLGTRQQLYLERFHDRAARLHRNRHEIGRVAAYAGHVPAIQYTPTQHCCPCRLDCSIKNVFELAGC